MCRAAWQEAAAPSERGGLFDEPGSLFDKPGCLWVSSTVSVGELGDSCRVGAVPVGALLVCVVSAVQIFIGALRRPGDQAGQ